MNASPHLPHPQKMHSDFNSEGGSRAFVMSYHDNAGVFFGEHFVLGVNRFVVYLVSVHSYFFLKCNFQFCNNESQDPG